MPMGIVGESCYPATLAQLRFVSDMLRESGGVLYEVLPGQTIPCEDIAVAFSPYYHPVSLEPYDEAAENAAEKIAERLASLLYRGTSFSRIAEVLRQDDVQALLAPLLKPDES
jgi:hypothetical protein